MRWVNRILQEWCLLKLGVQYFVMSGMINLMTTLLHTLNSHPLYWTAWSQSNRLNWTNIKNYPPSESMHFRRSSRCQQCFHFADDHPSNYTKLADHLPWCANVGCWPYFRFPFWAVTKRGNLLQMKRLMVENWKIDLNTKSSNYVTLPTFNYGIMFRLEFPVWGYFPSEVGWDPFIWHLSSDAAVFSLAPVCASCGGVRMIITGVTHMPHNISDLKCCRFRNHDENWKIFLWNLEILKSQECTSFHNRNKWRQSSCCKSVSAHPQPGLDCAPLIYQPVIVLSNQTDNKYFEKTSPCKNISHFRSLGSQTPLSAISAQWYFFWLPTEHPKKLKKQNLEGRFWVWYCEWRLFYY